MNSLTLNLTAVFIFLMTFSSLLGPLFHIPGEVPAIATISILGLVTVDNLTWQSKGSTILLDWLANFSAIHRDRVLRHEAAHFLVAYLLGIPINDYSLTAWEAFKKGQPGQGGISFTDNELTTQLQKGLISHQILDKYATVWMAGIAAEQIFFGNSEGGNDDRMKLTAILNQIGCNSSEVKTKFRFYVLQAQTLIKNNKLIYEALVTAMKNRLSVDECYRIIEEKII